MKKSIVLFLVMHSVCVFSEEYIITDKFEKDRLGRINSVTRTIRMNSDEVLHREKAKMIIFKEAGNIFQNWGGHIYVQIKGVGKVNYVNDKGKWARKYSKDAVTYSLAKEFSHLYFYDDEIGVEVEASDMFPQLERFKTKGLIPASEADCKFQEIIRSSDLKAQKKLQALEEQTKERKRKK